MRLLLPCVLGMLWHAAGVPIKADGGKLGPLFSVDPVFTGTPSVHALQQAPHGDGGIGPGSPEFEASSHAPAFDHSPDIYVTGREGLTDTISRIARTTTNDAGMYKIWVTMPRHGRIGFLLWLPSGFGNQTQGPWPTCFFLHGAGEGEWSPEDTDRCATDPHCLPPTNGSTLTFVARHGLPHRVELNEPFKNRFVLVAPQRPYLPPRTPGGGAISNWEDHMPIIDELRETLFASSDQFDPNRASVTGISAGAIGAIAWATYGYDQPDHPQPWAAVAIMSGMWPYFEGVHDVNNPPKIPSAAMDRFASVPGIFIAGCANDETIPIALGRQGGPPCIVLRLDDEHEVMCGFASDAIVERLKQAGHEEPVMYKRVDTCGAPFMPTDTGPALASWYNPLQGGHDSWNKIYASAEFADWLSVQTLNGQDPSSEDDGPNASAKAA